MTLSTMHGAAEPSRSVFAGVDVCREAGFTLPEQAARPVFDDDWWDFTQVIGLPRQLSRFSRRFDFTAIADPRWRLVAKELAMAMLAPRHDAVADLPRGYRTALHLTTVSGRLAELTRFLNWLTELGLAQLGDLDTDRCEAYLSYRRYVRDENGVVIGQRSPALRRAAAQVVVDLVNYRELFTADRVAVGLRPWAGASPSAIAEMPCGRDQNKTPPLPERVLQPMLAAAGYLVSALGAHAIELAEQVSAADQQWSVGSGQHTAISRVPTAEFAQLLAQHEHGREPLPVLPDHNVAARIAAGWCADDPLTPIALGLLARQAGFSQFLRQWTPQLRDRIESTLRVVGAQKPFARNAVDVDRADDDDGATAWTIPLDRMQAVALVGIVRTAAVILIAAVSGMRSSELMELQVGCCQPPERFGPDLARYRLASRLVKGQPLGGLADEWVVIEPAYRAAQLLEQLHHSAEPGAPLLGRFAFDVRYKWFRTWVNSPAGQRLGLAQLPDDNVTLRMLRRTLALELAYRPGGVLAAKLHLKHIAVATTEGYASRPGGAQAGLLTEVNKHESERNLALVLDEFRNYQQGILPAGPGARELTEFFAHVDAELDPAQTGAPKVQRSEQEMLNLLSKRAGVLHLGVANYCWFTDPSRALCLKLAGTPHADKPLASMCDSARCPQATHHRRHRPVWAEHVETTATFLGTLGPTRKIEKVRLQADQARAQRVLDEIDRAQPPTPRSD
jgi:hypothetical protein